MLNVTIDPSILALPSKLKSAKEIYEYAENLHEWSDLISDSSIRASIIDGGLEALQMDEYFPMYEHLNRSFSAHGIEEYSLQDIRILISGILRYQSFAEFSGVQDILIEEIETDPNILASALGSELRAALARCLVVISILRKHCSRMMEHHRLVVRPQLVSEIAVRARILELEHSRDDLCASLLTSERFADSAPVCGRVDQYIRSLDVESVLSNAASADHVRLAIRIALVQSAIGNDAQLFSELGDKVRVQDEFLASLREVQRQDSSISSRRILRVIEYTIRGQSLDSTHAIRVGKGANEMARTRKTDDARAMRRDISEDCHLHYWRLRNGVVEFARIAYPHDDFLIPE